MEKTALRQCIRLDYRFELPSEFDRRANKQSLEPAETQMSVEFSLQSGAPILDISGWVDNKSKNHRLRILVHTGIDTDRNTSSQPFDCVERSRFPEQPDLSQDWTHPNNGWVSVRNEYAQISVFTDSMYDYEHLPDARHSLAFSCVRSTGRITANEFGMSQDGILPSPEWASPENECVRAIPFHLAIRPGHISNAGLIREQQCWMAPLLTAFDSVDPHKFMAGRACVQESELTEIFHMDPVKEEINLPLRAHGVALSDTVAFSAYKQTENKEGYVLRFYNPSSDPVAVEMSGMSTVREMSVAEIPLGAAHPVVGKYGRDISPKRIVTIQLK